MRNNFVRLIVGILLGLAVAVLAAFNILLVWVVAAPRELNKFSPYIAASLQPADNSFSVKIGQTWLIWGGWEHPIDIKLHDVAVYTRDGQIFSNFPDISLGIDIW